MMQLPGKFVWFEHVSRDSGRARKFYDALFDWHAESLLLGNERYAMIYAGSPGHERAIGGYRSGEGAYWLPFVSVPDVDEAFREAVKAGATPLDEPFDLGPRGRAALIADPTGAPLTLWRGTRADLPDEGPVPHGMWCYSELHASDENTALGFYESVFGYSHETLAFGADSAYFLLQQGSSTQRAGIMRSPLHGSASAWMPYVAVDDCDDAATRVIELGGQLLMSPIDLPHVGRYAIFKDPVGARMAIVRHAAH